MLFAPYDVFNPNATESVSVSFDLDCPGGDLPSIGLQRGGEAMVNGSDRLEYQLSFCAQPLRGRLVQSNGAAGSYCAQVSQTDRWQNAFEPVGSNFAVRAWLAGVIAPKQDVSIGAYSDRVTLDFDY
jgi:hypothetical protein